MFPSTYFENYQNEKYFSDIEEDSVNFMPLLNQCEIEDELSPIDSLSLDTCTTSIFFEMNQILPSMYIYLNVSTIFQALILIFPKFQEDFSIWQ